MPTRQVIIPPCVKDELRKKIEQEGNRRFFWLDYVGAYIEQENRRVRGLDKKMKLSLIVNLVTLCLFSFLSKTSLVSVVSALLVTASCALVFFQVSLTTATIKTERLMGKFMRESQDMTFKMRGLR